MIYPWHEQQWSQLMQARRANKLPHALLLHGTAGTGKKGFADAVAGAMLCQQPLADGHACGQCSACQLLAAGTHPDLSIIRPAPPENSTSKTPMLNIRIDAIRRLCERLGTTSQYGGYRVAILEDAERMVIPAANALLKTLEEPGANTLMLLISSRPHRLPITIRSRCQLLRFPVPDAARAAAWLAADGAADPTLALKLAHGAPLSAAQLAGEQLAERELLSKALLAASRGESSLAYSQQLAVLPKETLLVWMLDWLSDLAKLKTGLASSELVNHDFGDSLGKRAATADTRRIFALYDQVCGYIRKDGIALNMQFVWENLLVSWDRL